MPFVLIFAQFKKKCLVSEQNPGRVGKPEIDICFLFGLRRVAATEEKSVVM